MRAVKQSEIKSASRTINKFIVDNNGTEMKE